MRKRIKDQSKDFPPISAKAAWWYEKGYRNFVARVRPGLELPKNIKSSDDLLTVIKGYGFNGIEFGNYVTEEDKFNYLVAFYFAIYDMNKILGFQKNMGLDKMITIGYGSRGLGGTLAHFRPTNNFININRYEKVLDIQKPAAFFSSGGINSFAHEYAHALDYILGGYVERSSTNYPLTMGNSVARKWDRSRITSPMRSTMNELIHAFIWKDKNETGFTESYSKIAKASDYYRQHNEIFARLFEKYIHWKLAERQIKNLALTKNKYENAVYATDRDFKKLVPIMDKLVGQMRGHITSKYAPAKSVTQKMAAQGKLF